MIRFVLKRILAIIPILFGVTFIVFAILSMTPGDPGRLILGQSATQEAVDNMNKELGYDKPFLVQFFNYTKNAVTKFDFGRSYRTQKPVFDEILPRFPVTLRLAIISVSLSALIGIPLGILSAVRQYSFGDTVLTLIAMFLASVPGFWLGMMLVLLFTLRLALLPSNGIDTWKHFILPTLTLSLPSAASLMRITRSTMLETIRQDYIRTARAKGAPEKRVILRHALKNALLPVITVLGMIFGSLLGGAIIVESVFAMPGLGTYILTAIRMKDVPLVLATTIFLAGIFCLVMVAVDLLYGIVDPRVKAKFINKKRIRPKR